MPPRTEVLGDGTIGGKEPLGLTRRLKALHAPLALTGGLVGVLGTVIEIPVLAMFHPWKDLALGRSIALQIVLLALDCQNHLIHVPLVTGPGTAATELLGVRLPEFATPFADGLVGYNHSAFQQQLFDISKAQAEAKVQPDSVADNLHGKAVILVFRHARRCVHALITSHQAAVAQASQEVDNAKQNDSLERYLHQAACFS